VYRGTAAKGPGTFFDTGETETRMPRGRLAVKPAAVVPDDDLGAVEIAAQHHRDV
jgi:hypothetical protein